VCRPYCVPEPDLAGSHSPKVAAHVALPAARARLLTYMAAMCVCGSIENARCTVWIDRRCPLTHPRDSKALLPLAAQSLLDRTKRTSYCRDVTHVKPAQFSLVP
jgi:hypothetical protein